MRRIGISAFENRHTRICRVVGLTDRQNLISFVIARVGNKYDLRNVFDLVRYFLPQPPVPQRFRRRMLALGSGDPTRAICSTLIAQAFQSIRYPILPTITGQDVIGPRRRRKDYRILRARHHSLFTPRDFDVSPYFKTIKPTVAAGFDFHRLTRHEPTSGPPG